MVTHDASKHLERILTAEIAKFEERTPASKTLFERASQAMPFGVASSFQAGDPYPIYLKAGRGSQVVDVDDNSYIDFHNGFGAMAVGHAHPVIRRAIEKAAATGTHFAATTEVAIALAEELKRRFGLEKVRFTNSGTEATMDAVRLARAASGRDVLLKIEGSYHGHHDAVMYSIVPSLDSGGPDERPWSVPFSRGIPAETAASTKIVPFNDVAALETTIDELDGRVGALIMEPVMMNIGIVLPKPGYLHRVREVCSAHDIVLIFDEVKTGVTIAPGGATEYFGVQPDLVCLAKSIGGGTPVGAFGGKASLMDEIEDGVAALGTFNGNPLSMAAGLAALTEVLTDEAYDHLRQLGTRLASGCQKALDEHGIAGVAMDLGCKGSITFRDRPLERYRDFNEVDDSLFEAYWYWLVNRGIFQTPGKEEQWTISVQHSAEDVDRFVEVFESYCEAATAYAA
ncbi:MAG TPA: aspartate aminotransferase family protein [Actinomycetota bacterium]|nr:aspartate aminotransferase family protein [Actinomycetota bacterium]